MVGKTCELMRNILFILLFIGIGVNAQGPIANTSHIGGSSTSSYTDNYSTLSTGDLDGQGGWTVIDGALVVATESGNNVVKGNTAGYNAAVYDGSYSSDQYAWDTVYVGEYTSAGPLVLGTAGSGGSYYTYAYDNSGTSFLARINNGAITFLDYGSSHSDEDLIRIEAEVGGSATVITCYINGVADSSIGTSGAYTDSNASRLTSGSPGIFVFWNSSSGYSTYSAGGDL